MQYTKLWKGQALAKSNLLHDELENLIKQGFKIDMVIPYYYMNDILHQAIIIYSKKD